jgi:hypothetical protein
MKTFSTGVRTEMYRDHFIAIDLVRIDLTTPLYLASGGLNLVFDGNEYTAQGDFIGFSRLQEDFDVKVGKFEIFLSGINTSTVNTFVDDDFEGSRVRVYKAFLDLNTGAVVDSQPVLMFDGQIYNAQITEGQRTCQINVECSSLFADFERIAGRKTNSGSNHLFQGTTADKAFDKSGFVGTEEFRWGRK